MALRIEPRIFIPQQIETLATTLVDAALAVHRELGPGLLEGAYRECLNFELKSRGLGVAREHVLALNYRGCSIQNAYRCDLLINDALLVELKAVDELHPVNFVQVITYLKLLKLPLGFLINFNVPLIRAGIHRVLNIPKNTS